MNGHDDKRTTPPTPHRLRFLIQPVPLACLAMLATGSALAMNGTSSMSSSVKTAHDRTPRSGLLKDALVQSTAGQRGTDETIKYRMEPLPDRPAPYTDMRMKLWLPDQGMKAMYRSDWDEYSAFRLNDVGQVSGWTNLAFPCDDSTNPDNPSLTGRPTAATWIRDVGAYPDITLLKFGDLESHDVYARSAMATGISESGKIVGFRQFEGPDSYVIDHCSGKAYDYFQAVYWADEQSAGTEFPLHDDPPQGYESIQRSAAFDVIDIENEVENEVKITGIVEYEICSGAGNVDRWYCWNPDDDVVVQPPAPTDYSVRDTHMLEFCNDSGTTSIGSALPGETGLYANCGYCPSARCPIWQYSCCFSFRGFGSYTSCAVGPKFNPKITVLEGSCDLPASDPNGCTSVWEFLDFVSEVNRAADKDSVTGWRLGGDAGNEFCGGACCVNGACGPSTGPDDCHSQGGYYLGDNTCCDGTCHPDDTVDEDNCTAKCPTGVCCIDETCYDIPYNDCITSYPIVGTFYFGYSCSDTDDNGDSVCSAETGTTGACCFGEMCSVTSEEICTESGGTYNNDNTDCDDTDCTVISNDDCCWTQAIYRNGYDSESVLITQSSTGPGPDDIGGEVLNSRGLGIRTSGSFPGGVHTRIVGWQDSDGIDPDYNSFDSTQAILWENPATAGNVWPATNLDKLLQNDQISLGGLNAYADRPFPNADLDELDLRLREAHDINNNGEIVAILRIKLDRSYRDIGVVLIPAQDCSSKCEGDFDGNNVVDGADLTLLLGCWGNTDPDDCVCEDLNGDGIIDGADLTMLLGNWGICRGAGSVRESKK